MLPFLKILAIVAFAALFFIIPALVIIYIIRVARKTSVNQGLCRNCGYNLLIPRDQRGTEGGRNESDRCPQCGRPFVRDAEGIPFS